MFKRCTIVVGVLACCSWVTIVFGVIFYCVPMKKLWTPSVPGHCTDFGAFYLSMAIIDLLLDVFLLCLPLWVISHLQLPRKHQWSLAIVFLLGGL